MTQVLNLSGFVPAQATVPGAADAGMVTAAAADIFGLLAGMTGDDLPLAVLTPSSAFLPTLPMDEGLSLMSVLSGMAAEPPAPQQIVQVAVAVPLAAQPVDVVAPLRDEPVDSCGIPDSDPAKVPATGPEDIDHSGDSETFAADVALVMLAALPACGLPIPPPDARTEPLPDQAVRQSVPASRPGHAPAPSGPFVAAVRVTPSPSVDTTIQPDGTLSPTVCPASAPHPAQAAAPGSDTGLAVARLALVADHAPSPSGKGGGAVSSTPPPAEVRPARSGQQVPDTLHNTALRSEKLPAERVDRSTAGEAKPRSTTGHAPPATGQAPIPAQVRRVGVTIEPTADPAKIETGLAEFVEGGSLPTSAILVSKPSHATVSGGERLLRSLWLTVTADLTTENAEPQPAKPGPSSTVIPSVAVGKSAAAPPEAEVPDAVLPTDSGRPPLIRQSAGIGSDMAETTRVSPATAKGSLADQPGIVAPPAEVGALVAHPSRIAQVHHAEVPTAAAISPPSAPVQIVQAVTGSGDAVTELRLSPEELGHVRIDLRSDGDRLVMTVSAERRDTLDLLRRHADQLSAEMRAAGHQGLDLSFSRWDGPGTDDRPQAASPTRPDDTAPATVTHSTEPTRPPLPVTGLYLRI